MTFVFPGKMQLAHLNTSQASREEKPVRLRTGWNAGLADRGHGGLGEAFSVVRAYLVREENS